MLTQQQTQTREREGTEQIMVVAQGEDGFRVYAANDPGKVFDVTGSPETPECNCPEFQWRKGKPGYRCAHIEAVFHETGMAVAGSASPVGQEQHQPFAVSAANGNGSEGLCGTAVMVLKRSVSPDGRIDSLSVEFSQPVGDVAAAEVVDQAIQTLLAQSAIVHEFLNGGEVEAGNRSGAGQPAAVGSEPAQMTDIGGMQTRWGWRYFINVKINGNTAKLFGTRRQIGDYLTAAGYPNQSGKVAKGVTLNLPCRVVTQPSEDGRYLNVAQVLPAQPAVSACQGRVH